MVKCKADELAREINDSLSYVLVYAPTFPREDATTTEEQMDALLLRVKELWSTLQDVERRRWLDAIGRELVEAQQKFANSDEDGGRALIESAQEHFRAWQQRKSRKASFVVDAVGGARKND